MRLRGSTISSAGDDQVYDIQVYLKCALHFAVAMCMCVRMYVYVYICIYVHKHRHTDGSCAILEVFYYSIAQIVWHHDRKQVQIEQGVLVYS
jgi:hypothetical protein